MGYRLHYNVKVEAEPGLHLFQEISPWHDIPLFTGAEDLCNFICEIPAGHKEKMEVATKEEMNPIAQDTKKGKLRCYTYPASKPAIPFNYGMFPQTWENPDLMDPIINLAGDNDPLDVVELGEPIPYGAVVPVRILGASAMVDEGETDWKIIAVRQDSDWKVLTDVPTSLIKGMHEWFRMYKTTDGKPENTFAFDEPLVGSQMWDVVQTASKHWSSLLADTKEASSTKLWLPSGK